MSENGERPVERARSERATDGATRRSFLRAGGAGAAALALGTSVGTAAAEVPTPRLYVDGKWVKDPSGNTVKLRGASIADPRWIDQQSAWLGKTAEEALAMLTDESRGWHPNHVRLPVTQDEVDNAGGYQSYIDGTLRPLVDFLGEQGVYAVVDNHIIKDYDTEETDQILREFWSAMAPEFADDEHVVYELFNEPIGPRDNGVQSWNNWRNHAQPWLELVREHAPATPVIVGSPMWCQLTNHAHQNPFIDDNVIYAAHIYTQEYMRPWDEYFGETVSELPLINSEWGWDATSDSVVDSDTRDNYGAPLREWTEAHDNIHWTAWCFDPSWGPTMVESTDDGEWNLLGGNDHHGEFVKQWLADTRDSLQPQVASGTTPFERDFGSDGTAPPAPADLTVERATEEVVDLSWTEPTDEGVSGLSHYELTVDGERWRDVDDGNSETSIHGFEPATTYEVGLAAVDRAGNASDPATATVETLARDENQSAHADHVLPGRIEAEDFDEGGNGVSYYDTTPGNNGGRYRETDVDVESREDGDHNVGWVSDGEWWEYTAEAETSATYVMRIRVASDSGGGQVRVEIDGEEVGNTNVWPTGGWGEWLEIRVGEVDLSAGEHLVRVVTESGGFNYDSIHFEVQGDYQPPEDATAPDAPANLTVADRTTSSVTLSWDAASDSGGSGLDHYAVTVDGSEATTVPAGTTEATVSDLTADTSYEFGVAAVDGAGNESTAATVSGSTTAETDERTLAVDLTAQQLYLDGIVDATITLSEAPDGVSGYDLSVAVGDTSVATVEGASYPEGWFNQGTEVADDGSSATLEAIDASESVQAGAEDVELATVTLQSQAVGETTVAVAVEALESDANGADIPVATQAGTLEVARHHPPRSVAQDLDGDGHYMDLNGNDKIDADDVVTYFNNYDQPEITDHVEAYDYNENGDIDFDDIVTLFQEY